MGPEILKIKELYLNKEKFDDHLGVGFLYPKCMLAAMMAVLEIPRRSGIPEYVFCCCCDISEFFYHPGENVVTLKSTLDDVNDSNVWTHFDPVNEITIRLESGKLESDKSELDFFVDFIKKLQPKKQIQQMTDEQLKSFLPADSSKKKEDKEMTMRNFELNHINYYRDFYRSYVSFISESPMSRKEFVEMMRSVEDVPKFVKEKLGWEKASMIEEAMIFFIFNKSCANSNGTNVCDNFTDKKCSKCKMINFCSTECFDQEWEHGHHSHCCGRMVSMKVSEMTRSNPKFLHARMEMLTRTEDIVKLETFCRELFRRIVLVFMELLTDTRLMLQSLERRKLDFCVRWDKENQRYVPVEGRDYKYSFTKAKIPTVIKDYDKVDKPVILVSTLQNQMEEAYGKENFLAWTLKDHENVQSQAAYMFGMMKLKQAGVLA